MLPFDRSFPLHFFLKPRMYLSLTCAPFFPAQCVDSKGKTVANWTQDGLTLSASSKVEPVLDRIVVTCFLNLWIRHLGQW